MVAFSKLKNYEIDWNGYTLIQFIENILLVQTWDPNFVLNWNYPSWSISSEWFAYLLFPSLIFILKPYEKSLPSAILLSILMALTTAWLITSWLGQPYYELILVVPTFLLGICLCLVSKLGKEWLTKRYFKHLIFINFLAIVSLFIPNYQINVYAFILLASLIFLQLSSNFYSKKIWEHNLIVSIGESSYSLYMTHTLAQKILYKLLPCQIFEHSTFEKKLTVFLIYLSFIIAISASTFFFIEKPFRKTFRSIIKRW
jgi:peptidoglycan/LPS O-acetylase OafA/YrhL